MMKVWMLLIAAVTAVPMLNSPDTGLGEKTPGSGMGSRVGGTGLSQPGATADLETDFDGSPSRFFNTNGNGILDGGVPDNTIGDVKSPVLQTPIDPLDAPSRSAISTHELTEQSQKPLEIPGFNSKLHRGDKADTGSSPGSKGILGELSRSEIEAKAMWVPKTDMDNPKHQSAGFLGSDLVESFDGTGSNELPTEAGVGNLSWGEKAGSDLSDVLESAEKQQRKTAGPGRFPVIEEVESDPLDLPVPGKLPLAEEVESDPLDLPVPELESLE